jgi:hypothetical protein
MNNCLSLQGLGGTQQGLFETLSVPTISTSDDQLELPAPIPMVVMRNETYDGVDISKNNEENIEKDCGSYERIDSGNNYLIQNTQSTQDAGNLPRYICI